MTLTAESISERLAATPTSPGVYTMRDAAGGVLYVGKAAVLRHRLRSYFGSPANLEPKIRQMVGLIADFEYLVTDTEAEALILENTLIKGHKPPYNARLKDDKTYPFIKIDLSEEFPQVYLTRRVKADGARYFGPYASAGSVRTTLALLKKLFPYRSCTKAITGDDDRPCLEYFIHRCVAPCTGYVSKEEYREVIQQVILFMEGRTERVLKDLRLKMQQASGGLEYERAAILRDQVRAIERVNEQQKVDSGGQEDQDILGMASTGSETWVEVFFIRHGKLIGRDHFLMEGTQDDAPSQVMAGFVKQFYDAAPHIPRELVLQHPVGEEAPLIEEWLTHKRGQRVRLHVPERGTKKRLASMAAENAAQGLKQRAIKWQSDSENLQQAMQEVAEALNLPRLPQRMECYDISNIQGTNSVGSLVVFEGGRPRNGHYRRFQIKSVVGVDDYSMMQEMLRRRFRRLAERLQTDQGGSTPGADPGQGELLANASPLSQPSPVKGEGGLFPTRRGTIYRAPTGGTPADADNRPLSRQGRGTEGEGKNEVRASGQVGTPLRPAEGQDALARPEGGLPQASNAAAKEDTWGIVPDLVIIDGGKGHLSAAHQVFLELGIAEAVPLASLAKEREELFLPHDPDSILLPRGSQGLFLVQRIRDEAHRFAITYHRQRRSKGSVRSALDAIAGIGPKRKRMLLRQFGSVAAVKEAPLSELAGVPGMTMKLAQKLKEGL
ncbi:MAG: excinuclease ABC subunit UvrC [Chloroflexi bacterium]|nr:excinuclease ABC subunit UvrC [Chloroflexota bacterium]